MNRQKIARELVAVARELAAAAPQMRPPKWTVSFGEIKTGQNFTWKRKKWVKVTGTKAVLLNDAKPIDRDERVEPK